MLDLKKPFLTVTNPARMRTAIGTPLFMAPEKLKALKLNEKEKRYEVGAFDEFKADIWSLGMLIWRIVLFNYPIDADTFEDMIEMAKDGMKIPEFLDDNLK